MEVCDVLVPILVDSRVMQWINCKRNLKQTNQTKISN